MTLRVEVKPDLLRWACERAGHDLDAFAPRFPKLPSWASGETSPTLKQLETFAKATHTPIGYFFLDEPPEERVPIPDFRTVTGRRAVRPSADLLETIYVCQQRQEWYRDHARSTGEAPVPFVGSASLNDGVVASAREIRDALGFDLDARAKMSTWTDALRHFIEQADAAGVMVMCSGVVMNDTTRRLDPQEFRGFALADELAPLVFINGADTKAAQMFTLAHELAHLWLGESGVSDADALRRSDVEIERWCDQVAAELLVPLVKIRGEYDRKNDLPKEVDPLARVFKVSNLVILRRIHDAGGLTRDQLWTAYDQEVERLRSVVRRGGGNFYLTQAARVSKRFARALVVSTLEGHTLYRDAFRMLGFAKQKTFQQLGHSLGVM